MGVTGTGGGSGGSAARSVDAIMAAMSSMVSAEPDRVFLRAGRSGGGEGGFSGPLVLTSPFSMGLGGDG